MDRGEAFALMCEYTASDSLRKHMLAVEAAVAAYARKFGEDEVKWSIVGLLHDFDYERWPDPPDHPLKGSEILRERGYPDDVIYAIKSHADYLEDCPRVSLMDKSLYACGASSFTEGTASQTMPFMDSAKSCCEMFVLAALRDMARPAP